jgi:hypothetical protein
VSVTDKIVQLDQLIPIIGTLTGNPLIGTLAQQLIDIANRELQGRAADTGKSTDEILQEASAAWDSALQNAQDLRNL